MLLVFFAAFLLCSIASAMACVRTLTIKGILMRQQGNQKTAAGPAKRLKAYTNPWRWLALILVIGAVLRGWYLVALLDAPDFEALRQDLDVQDYQARAMLSGDWSLPVHAPADPRIAETPYYRPPGYPYYLSVVYFFSGGSYLAPRIVNMIMGLGTIVLMFLLGRAVFGPLTGLICAFLMAVYPGLLYAEGEVNDPVLFLFLIPCLLLSLLWWSRRPGFSRALLPGFITGCYALMRPNILLFGPVMAGWMLYRMAQYRRIKSAGWPWAGLALATFLVIAPVTVRNYRVSGEFVPISTYFGQNLLIGNGPGSDAVTSWIPYLQELEGTGNFSVWCYDNIVQGLAKEQGLEDLSHSEASDIFFAKAIDFMADHPWRTLRLAFKKMVLFWSPVEITGNKVVQFEWEHYAPLRYLPGFWLVAGLFFGGTLLYLRDYRKGRAPHRLQGPGASSNEAMFLILAFIFVYYISFIPFFVNARARIPVIGLCLLTGAYGLNRIYAFFRFREWKRAAAWPLLFALLCALASIEYIPYEPDRCRWHFARADSWLRAGETGKALEEAEQMLTLEEQPKPYMPFQLGHAFAAAGRHDAAVKLLRAALAPHPDAENPRYRQDLHYHIACELVNAGRIEEGREGYRTALAMNPEDARIYNDLAVLREKEGDTAGAIAYYRKALEHAPDFALAHNNLGLLLAEQGRRAEGIAHFRKAMKAEPDQPRYPYNLGVYLAAAGKKEAAISAYKQAITLGKDDPRPHNNLGLLLAEQGKVKEALEHYRAAVRIAPDFTLAWANLGDLLARGGHPEKARAMYRRGLENNPEDAGLHNAIGWLCAEQGDAARAEEHYRQALRIAPDFARAARNLARLLADQGRHAEARQLLEDAISRNPDHEALRTALDNLPSGG
jgi:tetratricopeptide (TPR) repeat protein